MKIDKLSIDGKKQSIEVLDKIFSAKINNQLVSGIIYKLNANFKGRKAKTKQRNEITGSTSKIYSQKGTGNARHSSKKAPLFVGGGIAHGPKGQDNYKTRKLNKSEKKMSIASLITEKNKSNNVIIFDDFGKKIEKTKEMFELLKRFDANNSLLIVDTKSKDNILRSTKNIPNVKLTDANHFSAFDLVKYKKIIFTESSVKELEKRLSHIKKPITLSIIGCVVNGPGEAKQTEIGITGGGKDNHMLYLNGLETEKVMTKDMINKIVTLVEEKASNL